MRDPQQGIEDRFRSSIRKSVARRRAYLGAGGILLAVFTGIAANFSTAKAGKCAAATHPFNLHAGITCRRARELLADPESTVEAKRTALYRLHLALQDTIERLNRAADETPEIRKDVEDRFVGYRADMTR